MTLPLVVDESRPPPSLSFLGTRALALTNRSDAPVDVESLVRVLRQAPGVERLESLRIDAGSRLRDVAVLAAFPALRAVQIWGHELESLAGLGHFSGRFIEIDTSRNRKRSIDALADCTATQLVLRWAAERDIAALGRSRSMKNVTLYGCPRLSFAELAETPLAELALGPSSLTQLEDSASVRTLTGLHLQQCRKLEAFVGDHRGITELIVDACNALHFDTLACLRGLTRLELVKLRRPMPLSLIQRLPCLETVSIRGTPVVIDTHDLSTALPRLQTLHLSTTSPDAVQELQRRNPQVAITSDALRTPGAKPP